MNRHNDPQCKGRSVRQYTLALIQSLLMVVALSPAQASVPDAQPKLLQMTSAGHVLGFDYNGVYFASGDHLLKVEFAQTDGAQPISMESAANDSATPSSQRVVYSAVWPGVDLVYAVVDSGIVESTWKIAKGFNPDQIRLRYNRPVSIEKSGDLKVDFETGWMSESAPIAWQEINGRRVVVQVAFKSVDTVDNDSLVGFELGRYDPAYPLLIDPLVNWHTYMGSTYDDFAVDIALDGSGNIYVLGQSVASWGSPINPYAAGGMDVFVAKLSSDGTRLWNTFMGAPADGELDDWASALAVDGSGNVYVTGNSHASWGPPKVGYSYNGGQDAFVAKLDTNGVRLWNVFLGASSNDSGSGIAVDGSGNVYVAGTSWDSWMISVETFLVSHSGGASDVFVAKLNTNGVLQWNTFMGAGYVDESTALAIDDSGNIYVTGYSLGTWGDPVVLFTAGEADVFVAKLDNAGTQDWNTFMGSSDIDYSVDIAADNLGNVYVTGRSFASWGSPVNAFVVPAGGIESTNAFAVRLDGSGILQWNTFMSGEAVGTGGQSLITDTMGNIYVTGNSGGDTWGTPVIVTGDDPTFVGGAFVVNLDAAAGVEQWNAFLGGGFSDNGMGIAVDGSGDIYVVGSSIWSWGTPVNAYVGPNHEVFVARICNTCFTVDTSAPAWEGSLSPVSSVVLSGDTTSFDVTAEPGYSIDTVTGCSGSWTGINPYTTGPVTEDCTVTAAFTADVVYDYTISTDSIPAAGGTFNPTSMGVDAGYAATLEIIPNPGYALISATGCDGTLIMGTNPSTYEIYGVFGDCTVTATFSDNSHRVSTAAASGHVWFWPEFQDVIDGEVASFDVDPEFGYTLDTVTGCGGTWTGTNPYLTGPITENCTITATIVGENSKSSWLLFLPAIIGGRQ